MRGLIRHKNETICAFFNHFEQFESLDCMHPKAAFLILETFHEGHECNFHQVVNWSPR